MYIIEAENIAAIHFNRVAKLLFALSCGATMTTDFAVLNASDFTLMANSDMKTQFAICKRGKCECRVNGACPVVYERDKWEPEDYVPPLLEGSE
ncbi:MAG: hypothetical protein NWE79_00735 [Candidatus Bathyarchaeota archaeon]|nr:hypothetical protein [Candidatus Bathyarchaeota archaeon]